MTITELLSSIDSALISEISSDMSVIDITSVTNDSRSIVEGCAFIAPQGIGSHALDHLSAAQCERVAVVIYEAGYDIARFAPQHDKFIACKHLHAYVGDIARTFYAPQLAKPPIAITGTNGKTSVSHFIGQLAPYACIGTMGYGHPDKLQELSHTTPDAVSVQRILKKISTSFDSAAMEVSSHALCLHRVDAVAFETAVFTNLSQDHLDFHRDMDDYFAAKAKLFDMESVTTGVINTDDTYGLQLAQHCITKGKRVIAYGHNKNTHSFAEWVSIDSLSLSAKGLNIVLTLHLDDIQTTVALQTTLWGAFNAGNLVAAVLALYANGHDITTLLAAAPLLHGVCGRIEPIQLSDNTTAIIDYAHTPDALKNTLISVREHLCSQNGNETQGRIYTVFGCGGDRDTSKRPLMAEIVNRYSDIGIITDDNPRTETSESIIADITNSDIDHQRFHTIPSRREAILFGLEQLSEHDVLVIAGKGHEDYQIIGTTKHPFSDHAVIREWLS